MLGWSYPGGDLKCLVHFRAYYSTNISRTVCELKNRRLETFTNLLIKVRVNLEKEVEERRFFATPTTLTQMF